MTPIKGQRWDSVVTRRTVRVMCNPVEGYVMVRYKGAAPFLIHVNDWKHVFVLKPLGGTNK